MRIDHDGPLAGCGPFRDKRVWRWCRRCLKAGWSSSSVRGVDADYREPQGGYVQLRISRLMSSAGLCAALACWSWWGRIAGERCA